MLDEPTLFIFITLIFYRYVTIITVRIFMYMD